MGQPLCIMSAMHANQSLACTCMGNATELKVFSGRAVQSSEKCFSFWMTSQRFDLNQELWHRQHEVTVSMLVES